MSGGSEDGEVRRKSSERGGKAPQTLYLCFGGGSGSSGSQEWGTSATKAGVSTVFDKRKRSQVRAAPQ